MGSFSHDRVSRSFLRRRSSGPIFDPAAMDWVMVHATAFFFEPIGAEFEPNVPGSLLVQCGNVADRSRGVEVSVLADAQKAAPRALAESGASSVSR